MSDQSTDDSTYRSSISRRRVLRLSGATAAGLATVGAASSPGAADEHDDDEEHEEEPEEEEADDEGESTDSPPSAADAYFTETFDDDGYLDHFTQSPDGYHDVTDDHAYSGSTSLEVEIPSGSHDGIEGVVDPAEAGYADENQRALYAEYRVRFDPDFDGGPAGSKLPGFRNDEGSGRGGYGGNLPDGSNGWSARGMYTDRGDEGIGVGYYVYEMDTDGPYGDHYYSETIPRDEWTKIGQYISLNTVSDGEANEDGELKLWVDDELVLQEDGFRFTEEPERGVNDWLCVYHGSSYTPDSDQSVYFDEWRVAPAE